MDDLISRQAAIDVLHVCLPGIPLKRLNEILSAVPSAQPERKTGKWIRENIVLTSNPPQYQWHCSECGRLVHWFSAEILTDFCPNCGCKMER